jgi:predicted nicotinamide N-methyase
MTPTAAQLRTFVLTHTRLRPAPHVPELRLHLADDVTVVWQEAEEALGPVASEPPYWATAWAGGQAVARYLLDRPETVAGRTLLDLATGSGLVAIAAALAGAARVIANDVDPVGVAALRENLEANDVTGEVEVRLGDLVGGGVPDEDVVVAGDICYERRMAERMLQWLRNCHDAGRTVLLGDPGRAFLPRQGLREVARYEILGDPTLENAKVTSAAVFTFAPATS